jgi:crotonobetainyl-CoA:carnitine CoA-transferase CaiB-like acyl-CoA transferase
MTKLDKRPLKGIKILEISRVLASPFAGYQLGLLGAEVIKIEDPGVGDTMRHRGRGNKPELGKSGMHTGFLSVNANKRSLTLNLRGKEGQKIFRQLARKADVVIENLRTGTMARYRLGFKDLRKINPRIIYCSITGYGQTGPKKRHPAYDSVVQAASGMMSINGTPETAPLKIGTQLIDYGAGFSAVIGITSALFHRERTGKGRHIDVSLLDVALILMGYTITDVLTAGAVPRPLGNSFGPDAPTNRCFDTKNGILAVAANETHQQQHMWEAIGRTDIPGDPRFASAEARRANFEVLREEIEAAMKKKNAQEWEDILNEAGVPAMRVRTIPEILKHPQVKSRNLFHTFDNVPGAGISVTVPLAPFQLSEGGARIDLPPPNLGEHTAEILGSLGYSDKAIERLRAKRVV